MSHQYKINPLRFEGSDGKRYEEVGKLAWNTDFFKPGDLIVRECAKRKPRPTLEPGDCFSLNGEYFFTVGYVFRGVVVCYDSKGYESIHLTEQDQEQIVEIWRRGALLWKKGII